MSLNQVNLLGRIGKIETKYTPSGTAVTTFSLATSRRVLDKQTNSYQEKTEWTPCVSYGKLAETIGQHFQKGSEIFVTGRLQTRSWEDKNQQKRYKTEVIIETFSFTGGSRVGNNEQSNFDQRPQNNYGGGRPQQGFNQQNRATDNFDANNADFDSFDDSVPF